MTEFKNTFKETKYVESFQETDNPAMKESETSYLNEDKKSNKLFYSEDSKKPYDDALRSIGFISNTEEEKQSNKQENSKDAAYMSSEPYEKGADGKIYDRESGKAYDSIEAWKKKQEASVKRFYSTANYFERKAKKEWARFKNSEENGEPFYEKWNHYNCSQMCYEKAKINRAKAIEAMSTLGIFNTDSNDFESYKPA